jgi:DNA-directed RNA polymerase subunit RPC12/RpoP
MSISFHCENCGKKIEAPDNAGGKWGKCPRCKSKVYVPSTQQEGEEEELRLAPLDREDEQRKAKLIAEEVRLREDIMGETEAPEEGVAAKGKSASGKAEPLSEAELTTMIIGYLRQMADGELERAEQTAMTIIPNSSKAVKILEHIALSQIPEPELSDIPQQVLSGLIKGLRSRLR